MKRLFLFTIAFLFAFCINTKAQTKIFRGSIGGKSIEMKLTRNGNELSGTYAYDSVGKDLTVKGSAGPGNNVTLKEFDPTGKQTGTFEGEYKIEDPNEGVFVFTGNWKSPRSKTDSYFYLSEQAIEFTNGLRIAPKLIIEKRFGISVAYPQLVGNNSPAVQAFNRRVASEILKAVNDFKSEPPEDGRGYYETNYNVLLATDNYISVEINADVYSGGAHPNVDHYAFTYDLKKGRELKLADLFKPNGNYEEVLFDAAYKKLQERLRRDGEDPDTLPREELGSLSTWGMTRRGIVLTFDFPHVIEGLARNFVPYGDVKSILNSTGPAANLRR